MSHREHGVPSEPSPTRRIRHRARSSPSVYHAASFDTWLNEQSCVGCPLIPTLLGLPADSKPLNECCPPERQDCPWTVERS